jgi:hypothetical protein
VSPYEQMAAKYEANPQERSFEFYCDWHFKHGFVFSTPEFFIMGRQINKAWAEEWNAIPFDEITITPDTWYLHAFSGDMSKAWSILPWELPWIAFERVREGKRELTIVPFEQIKRLTMKTTQEAVL